MEPMLKARKGYFISSLRVRRVLIPLPDMLAYRCITTAVDDPEPGDQMLPDQVAFDDALIELGVYPKRGLVRGVFSKGWRGLHMDQVMPLKRSGKPLESLLYRLDSPHRQ